MNKVNKHKFATSEHGKLLTKLRKDRNYTQKQLAERAGMAQSTIAMIEREQLTINTKNLLKISKALSVSENTFMPSGSFNDNDYHEVINTNSEDLKDSDILIPFIDQDLSAGSGNFEYDKMTNKQFIVLHGDQIAQWLGLKNPKNCIAMPVSGDSMEPTIPNESIVILDRSITTFKGDGIYALTVDDTFYLKRTQQIPQGFMLISDNSAYSNIEVNANVYNVKIIGKLVKSLNKISF